MFNIGMGEGVLLLILGLIFLKPDQFSQSARWLGRHLHEARKIGRSFTQALLQDSDLKDFRNATKKVEEVVNAGKKAIREATDLGSSSDATTTGENDPFSTKAPAQRSPDGQAPPPSPTPEKSDVEEP